MKYIYEAVPKERWAAMSNAESVADILNSYGGEGWKLVGIDQYFYYFIKEVEEKIIQYENE